MREFRNTIVDVICSARSAWKKAAEATQSTTKHKAMPQNRLKFMRVGLPYSLVPLNHSAEHQNEEDLFPADSEYFPFPINRSNNVSSESFPGPKINISRPMNRKINGSAP